jgi:hypothetical protein
MPQPAQCLQDDKGRYLLGVSLIKQRVEWYRQDRFWNRWIVSLSLKL